MYCGILYLPYGLLCYSPGPELIAIFPQKQKKTDFYIVIEDEHKSKRKTWLLTLHTCFEFQNNSTLHMAKNANYLRSYLSF